MNEAFGRVLAAVAEDRVRTPGLSRGILAPPGRALGP